MYHQNQQFNVSGGAGGRGGGYAGSTASRPTTPRATGIGGSGGGGPVAPILASPQTYSYRQHQQQQQQQQQQQSSSSPLLPQPSFSSTSASSSSSSSNSSSSSLITIPLGVPIGPPPPRIWRFHPNHITSSPSSSDGLAGAQERRLRRAACNHIQETIKLALQEPFRRLGDANKFPASHFEQKMRLPASTAMVLFNRFFMRQSFYRHSRWHVATACAFLGLKVEEMHEKIGSIMTASWDVFFRGTRPHLVHKTPTFDQVRQEIIDKERCLLYTLEFDVAVEHPYPFIKTQVMSWKEAGIFGSSFPRGKPLKDAPFEVTSAMILANNLAFTSLGTDLCLRYSAQEIALACLCMGLELSFVRKAGKEASPIASEHFAKIIDLAVLREICDRFQSYLEEDLQQDPDFFAEETRRKKISATDKDDDDMEDGVAGGGGTGIAVVEYSNVGSLSVVDMPEEGEEITPTAAAATDSSGVEMTARSSDTIIDQFADEQPNLVPAPMASSSLSSSSSSSSSATPAWMNAAAKLSKQR